MDISLCASFSCLYIVTQRFLCMIHSQISAHWHESRLMSWMSCLSSMIVISKGMKAVAVSVYSVSSDACSKLNAGDTIFIADPTLQTIELDVHGEVPSIS